jgi:hypothetical protein
MRSRIPYRRAVGVLLTGLVLGCLLVPVVGRAQIVLVDAVSREVTLFVADPLVAYVDAVSREVTLFVADPLVAYGDAVSREVTLFVADPLVAYADAVSREVTFLIPVVTIAYVDASSREVTFMAPDGPLVPEDGISRESTFHFLGTVAVRAGFMGREFMKVPADTVRWMALAVAPRPVSGAADLYVAAATRLRGAVTDPPDDFVYRVYWTGAVESWLTLPEATADPVGIAVSPGTPWDSTPTAAQVFVGLREALGTTTGPALMRYDMAGVGQIFAAGAALASDPRHLRFLPGPVAGFSDLLYWANGAGSPSLVSVGSGGAPAGYAASVSGGVDGLAFTGGSAFDAGLYLGGEGRTVCLTDASGQTAPLTADLGAGIEALAFGTSHGFEDYLYALLDDGRVMRIGPEGAAEEFLSGILPAPPPPDDRRNDLCFASGGDRLFVTDAVRGLVYMIQGNPPSGVDPDEELPPRLTELRGNFPNPFNPSTTIRFALAAAGPATLDIYDISGRRVRRLLSGAALPVGEHRVIWDGRDDAGRVAAAGVYLVSLKTREKAFSGKIALVK